MSSSTVLLAIEDIVAQVVNQREEPQTNNQNNDHNKCKYQRDPGFGVIGLGCLATIAIGSNHLVGLCCSHSGKQTTNDTRQEALTRIDATKFLAHQHKARRTACEPIYGQAAADIDGKAGATGQQAYHYSHNNRGDDNRLRSVEYRCGKSRDDR